MVRVNNNRYERIDKPGVSGKDTKDSSDGDGGDNSHNFCVSAIFGWLYLLCSIFVSGGSFFSV